MPEVQTTQMSGEMSQRFVSFVLMQAQQISLCLGHLPHPETGKPAPNLEAARLLIDHLEMIREKTRGNLTSEESHILNQVVADLQLAFVKASSEQPAPQAQGASNAGADENQPQPPPTAEDEARDEGKKRFSKSYG